MYTCMCMIKHAVCSRNMAAGQMQRAQDEWMTVILCNRVRTRVSTMYHTGTQLIQVGPCTHSCLTIQVFPCLASLKLLLAGMLFVRGHISGAVCLWDFCLIEFDYHWLHTSWGVEA